MDSTILDAIKKTAAIPSMPQVVVRFLEIIQDPAFDYNDLARVLSTDAGTAAELLRLTNSALFGLRSKVTSLKQALTILGPKRTRSFVLGRYLVATMGGPKSGPLDISYFWRRSLTTGILATRFGEKLAPRDKDDLFIAGLLADVGIPILTEAFPKKYEAIARNFAPKCKPVTEAGEVEAVGITHAEVSQAVLDEWGLPESICRAVADHQKALSAAGPDRLAARIICASDVISRLHCELPAEFEIIEACTEACTLLGMDLGALFEVLAGLESHVQELASSLKIDIISSTIYSLLAQTIKQSLESVVAHS